MSTILVLSDGILEDIFLRLDDAADVVRASAACKSHRSVICSRRFLRRYRFRHAPPVLGFLGHDPMENGAPVFLHAEAPHKSAPAATSLAQAADFTFSFLPMDPANPFPWRIKDARDGRVLLSRPSADGSATFLDLVICDPLYRRHVPIPPVPEDLWPRRYSADMDSEPFLLPAREEEDESRFRVIYNWVCAYQIISFLFEYSGSSSTAAESNSNSSWSVLTSFRFVSPIHYTTMKSLARHRRRHYVGSCFYWLHRHGQEYMLVLDPLEKKFSVAGLPYCWGEKAVFDAGVNRLGTADLGLARNLNLYSKTRRNNNGGSTEEEWQHDTHHQLPDESKSNTTYRIRGAAEGYLLLEGTGWHPNLEKLPYFILDLKTLQLERFCKSVHALHQALPYARFPPSILSTPSV